jgi:alkanesulfonate monooxygenase SsuD/methylene tetrahydromethanopterin reductase-like flavin-dependent oxidoreductase (luciferase family)
VELAKLLEAAKFHGIFIADVLGGYDVSLQQWKRRSRALTRMKVYNGNLDAAKISGAQWPVNEPLSVVSAMAAATKSIGFGVTDCQQLIT